MVSLTRSLNTNSGGATFFSESQNMDEREYLEPILESYGVFKPLRSIPVITLHLITTLGLEITAIIYTIIHPEKDSNCREYFTLIYIELGLWLLTLVIDQILRMKHYALRMNGYLDFYKKTQVLYRLPLYMVSLMVACVALLQTLMQHYYGDNFTKNCLNGTFFSPIGYICLTLTVQFCVIALIDIRYIVLVAKFNVQKPPPDVQKEEWNACSSVDSFAHGEIGYRQRGDKFFDFIEKQADLIRHLKDHNAKLGEKLMILNAQMQNRARSGTSNA
ncbi:transmembrane protein 192 isoform X2 [Onthophagus taurus]|uniref:transmembrane protein 192 isoform X2 n=1 Tax=Onthophagus taurus TaxID=166361 RepID=UPI000C20734E|nr:transmembrane protein 192 isoform X1 [Onthophagus taurus]